MSEEIERITVGPSGIRVFGNTEHKRGICQCGHAKAFHRLGVYACSHRELRTEVNGKPSNSWWHPCWCEHYTEVKESRRPRRWVLYAALGVSLVDAIALAWFLLRR